MTLLRLCLVFLIAVPSSYSQTASSTETAEFEAASLKPDNYANHWNVRGGPGTADSGRMTYTGVTLRVLIARAYDIPAARVFGPAWIDSDRYTLEAILPPDTPEPRFELMLRNFLAERFGIVLHHENRKVSDYYSLTVAKGGPRLLSPANPPNEDDAPSAPSNAPHPRYPVASDGCPVLPAAARPGMASNSVRFGVYCVRFTRHSMAQLAISLQRLLLIDGDIPESGEVVDDTGLQGEFDFSLTIHLLPAPPAHPEMRAKMSAMDTGDGPSIPDALEHQLGLRLDKVKDAVDSLMIDDARRVPSEN
jgi:uncharacterized protein (TIGR03435 family)